MELKRELEERFYRYAAIATQSRQGAGVVPSTPGQWELAKLLMKELEEMGLKDITLSDTCVVTGRLPARLPEGHASVPVIGWVTHLDTVDVSMSESVHPVTVRAYPGGDIARDENPMLLSEHPELAEYIGQDIIVSDGTSVLGADNKAAITNVMTALNALVQDESIPHGEIWAAFVPDEEIGLYGAKSMDLTKFPVDYAYTIDCCATGEVVWQTFNAGSAHLYIRGVTAHPMSSKNNLVNPALAAVDYVNLLDRAETPEHTEKTEGYIWVTGIQADVLTARVDLNIRDHSREKYEVKKAYLESALELIRKKHPKAAFRLEMSDTYGNIADAVTDENRGCIDRLYEKMKELGIEANTIAMRGGTDGSWLSLRGILTPNYFTGARNFHSVYEFMPMDEVEKSCRLTIALMKAD